MKINLSNQLEFIVAQKQQEVSQLKKILAAQGEHPINQILYDQSFQPNSKNFKQALLTKNLSVIAEIKRRSPSRGNLSIISDPVRLAENYVNSGANAISILTDENFFGGSLQDLQKVSMRLQNHPIPILRKDFIIDKVQIAQAVYYGANAVLLMVSILGAQIKLLLDHAKQMNMACLVEVHNHQELDIALNAGAEIIGINNRDLRTFKININNAFDLIKFMPKNTIKIAESGILKPELAKAYYQAGFDGVLIGEALVLSNHPQQFIQACRDES